MSIMKNKIKKKKLWGRKNQPRFGEKSPDIRDQGGAPSLPGEVEGVEKSRIRA